MKIVDRALLFLTICVVLELAVPLRLQADANDQLTSDAYELVEEPFEEEEAEPWLPENMEIIWETLLRDYRQRKDHDLNPDGRVLDFSEREKQTAIDLDWHPQVTDSIMFRSRGLLFHGQFDDRLESDSKLLEGYLQWKNTSQTLVADVGKVKMEWGSGYAWNPTQVLVFPTNDDNAFIDDHEGIGMVRVAWTNDLLTVTAVAADFDNDKIEAEDPLQSAIKITLNADPWELELLHYQASEADAVGGVSFSGLLSDALEVHGEWSRSTERDRYRIGNASDGIDMGTSYLPARYLYEEDDRDLNFDRILLGGQYTFSNDVNIIVELYRTTHGYDDDEWKMAEQGIDEALRGGAWKNPNPPYTTTQGNPYAGFLMNTAAAVKNEQLRQNYLFFRLSSGESDSHWEWEQILFLNLDDNSQLHQAVIHKSWLEAVTSSLEVTLFRGDSRSEYGLNPYSEILSFTLEYHF